MVFPSLIFNVEPGVVSQISGWAILGISYLVHKMKKIWILSFLVVAGVFFAYSKSHAIAMVNSQYYPHYPMQTQNFMNYYGTPWGYSPSIYFYPQLSYPMMMPMQQQYYFMPHPMSPYNPAYYCPTCNLPPQQNPFPVIHPGGGVS